MTRVLRDQSPNPSRILSDSTPFPQSTILSAPAFQSTAPLSMRPKQITITDESTTSQSETESKPQKQKLCPNAKLRLHIDDLTHPAIPKFTKVAPLSTLIEDAIKHVQAHLFTPRSPNHETWKPQEVRSITLFVQPMDGVAYTTGTELDEAHKEIHLSLDYLQARIEQFYGDANSDKANPKADASFIHELCGVVTHEMVHAFQHNACGTCPGGLVEGIADYVRLKSGLGAEHWNPWPAGKRTRGEKWDAGYQTTAWFLEWVEDNIGGEGAIGRLNEALRKDEWDEGKVWETIIGKSVKACWRAYTEDWERMNKEHENGNEVEANEQDTED